MKALVIFIFLIVLSKGIYAQEKRSHILPLHNNKVKYESVVKVDSVSRDEIYKRARRWLAYTYDVIKLDDKNELVGRGYVKYKNYYIWQTITIQIKDQRYKYEIADFQIKRFDVINGSSYILDEKLELYSKASNELFKKIDTMINESILSLEKTIKNSIIDNW